MSEKPVSDKRVIDWEMIEAHYRAGIRSLRNIAGEFGLSDVAIVKRAKRDGWTRDLKAKIAAKAAAKINEAAVSKPVVAAGSQRPVSARAKISQAAIVEANADIRVSAELAQREDVLLGLSVSRGMLMEVARLSDPRFAELLEDIGREYDESGPTASGGWKNDKANELYKYIISLAGRVKNAKDIAATHGVYIPLQRKVLKMDDEADTGANAVDDLLARVLGG